VKGIFKEIFYRLHKTGTKAVSLEAMEDAIRNRMKDKFE